MKCILLQLLLITLSRGQSPSEWRPVGQGDPLIDPTHVYSPPVVEHVHYWMEPRHRPRVDLTTNKGSPLGFTHGTHHHHHHRHKFPHYIDSGLYREDFSNFGNSKDATMDQTFNGPFTGSIQQNYAFHQRNNLSHNSVNYQPIQDSLPNFNRGPTSIDFQRISPKEQFVGNIENEKLEFLSTSSTLPPSSSLETSIISFALVPPPERAITLGQVTGWPHISTHLHPNNINTPSSTPEDNTLISITTTTTTTEPTTSTTTTTTTPAPVSFVIEGHSKVKKYGPLPESFNNINLVNDNHLANDKCKHCIDLPVAKLKAITNPS